MKPRAAHQPRSRRLGPGTTSSILPRNRARASWGVAAALSPVPSAEPPPDAGPPPPVRGRREPHGGVAVAGSGFSALGVGGGLTRGAAPAGTPRLPPPGSPHKGAHRGAALTGQSGLRAPASGRAGRLAGGCARPSVRVSACVPVCVCASVCV